MEMYTFEMHWLGKTCLFAFEKPANANCFPTLMPVFAVVKPSSCGRASGDVCGKLPLRCRTQIGLLQQQMENTNSLAGSAGSWTKSATHTQTEKKTHTHTHARKRFGSYISIDMLLLCEVESAKWPTGQTRLPALTRPRLVAQPVFCTLLSPGSLQLFLFPSPTAIWWWICSAEESWGCWEAERDWEMMWAFLGSAGQPIGCQRTCTRHQAWPWLLPIMTLRPVWRVLKGKIAA